MKYFWERKVFFRESADSAQSQFWVHVSWKQHFWLLKFLVSQLWTLKSKLYFVNRSSLLSLQVLLPPCRLSKTPGPPRSVRVLQLGCSQAAAAAATQMKGPMCPSHREAPPRAPPSSSSPKRQERRPSPRRGTNRSGTFSPKMQISTRRRTLKRMLRYVCEFWHDTLAFGIWQWLLALGFLYLQDLRLF